MRPMRAVFLILAVAGTCLAGSGCGNRESAPSSSTESSASPRWIHRYVPKDQQNYRPEDDHWRPESEGPRKRDAAPGMVVWEVSESPPGSMPTPEEALAADDLVERSYAAALRHGWHEYARGLADGYQKVDRHHYRNDELMLDDRVLDPDHPEVLMYYATPPDGQRRLAGFMFYARTREARGPQIGGPLTIWHYHTWLRPQCVERGLGVKWSVDGKCERGVPSQFSGEMMHVWLVDHPQGRFGTPMYLPDDVLMPGLERRLEERGF